MARNAKVVRGAVLATVLATGPATASVAAAETPVSGPAAHRTTAEGRPEPHSAYDARRGSGAGAAAAVLRSAARASARPATEALRDAIGGEVLVDIDGTTGTPRLVARLDGYLTAASRRAPERVALGYVAAHHAALGLSASDLATFRFRRDYRDIAGVHHLSWTQTVGGAAVFGNGLTASVTSAGRLLTVGGSPVSGADPAIRPGSRTLSSGAAAIRAARRDLGEQSTTPGPRDLAHQVLFVTRHGSHLGWQTVTMSAQHPALSVLDAHSGRLLFRRSLSAEASGGDRSSGGLAFRYFPGAARGGVAVPVDYARRGWLDRHARTLSGNNSHTYSDVNDDNSAQGTEEVGPSDDHRWDYRLQPFHLAGVSFCDNPYPCSWDPDTPYSWQVNRAQNATQVFSFVNRWHDHLRGGPIGFTDAAGSFQLRNRRSATGAGDPVDTQTDDGADTADGLPDGDHVDNANMDTPPDGQSPTMQMYLQHQPGTSYPDGDPFSPTNVGDEADTVYHEYTHGMSNRLVVDASGNSTLGPVQAGAMGEGWSDWYAMDDLVATGLQPDRRRTADVVLFQYDGEGVFLDRTEPIDCTVGSTSARCTGGATGHTGGYTYADYADVGGGAEVHDDGEIWSQTLWDLRDALGSSRTESLVTRAMELSPGNPSFLDERNAILMADTAVFGGSNHRAIWRVFAARGMGFYAGALGGDDVAPGADFHAPPRHPATGTLTGRVTDRDSGRAVPGLTVTLAFQGGGGAVNPSATTDAAGGYAIGPVPVGTYPRLLVSGPGYDPATTAVTVTRSGAMTNLTVRRDWAASSGGATIASFTGPDQGPECGPLQAIDNSHASGWESTAGDDAATPTNVFVPKFVVVDMHRAVDVSQFAVDPAAGCGDGGSASTSAYRIDTSPDGTTWTTAARGAFTSADNGTLNPVTPSAGGAGARYVRFWILGNQTPDFATSCPGGAFAGCRYADLTELEVYGRPSS
jgi:extracellular elastinolytic metalloproteinase